VHVQGQAPDISVEVMIEQPGCRPHVVGVGALALASGVLAPAVVGSEAWWDPQRAQSAKRNPRFFLR